MKTSVVFPQLEIGSDAIIIRDFVQAVEGLGFDCLHMMDLVLGANPGREGGFPGRYSRHDAHHEPFVLCGYLAAVTTRLEFATGILVLPQRPTALVAKQATELDILCGGRLRLDVGVGESYLDMQALGYEWQTRGKRIEEQVLVLRELWTKPLVRFEGAYHKIEDMGLNPMPLQRPIPIWFGGDADIVIRRTARLGDGWMLNRTFPDEAVEPPTRLHRYLDERGRSIEDFGIDIRVNLSKHIRSSWPRLVEDWRALGVTCMGVNTHGAGYRTLDERLDALRLFKEETGL